MKETSSLTCPMCGVHLIRSFSSHKQLRLGKKSRFFHDRVFRCKGCGFEMVIRIPFTLEPVRIPADDYAYMLQEIRKNVSSEDL